ncbi:MAG: bifunctional UDP-N-acetylglucosamine diphosphorylase/glucosamine-1-phosphate N-acetyltransferase GlmU [Fusobacteriaceae bacterium]|jgi:bifunctional UDP-N-acetylglucosamine pyrophosphorylase/glucosamine-1-phosphate N-acetyltransferase|nr:bifunctional UDP-N-acetylglucosamine diphosphorylase/glucosamine-1-phosphate N-acetyltransferase GlmU [Fusobacteriaceae bacterium]
MDFMTIILAAGKGTRMCSNLPKVVHKVNGIPMICKIIGEIEKLNPQKNIVVLGHMKEIVEKAIEEKIIGKNAKIEYVLQEEQLGTGHAVLSTKGNFSEYNGDIMLLYGDTPLLRSQTLSDFYEYHKKSDATTTVMTTICENPYGYGRIIKDNNQVKKIIEEKEASTEEKKIKEVNAGVYCFKSRDLLNALDKINNNNEKGEYYLTDVISIQVSENKNIKSYILTDNVEVMGVNSKIELAEASKILRTRKNNELMKDGVILIDPDNTYIEENVEIGKDTVIYPGANLQGRTKIGENSEIIGNTRIIDSILGNNVKIENSVIEESIVENYVTIGPFAHLRKGSHLKEYVHIGNFVETKKSTLEKGVKSGHLTYLGDTHVGENTNIGAGTITCNFDGINKFKTEIGRDAFIGSDSILVAPVVIGDNALIGAGSVITKNVPDNALSVERNKQLIKTGWRKK